MHPNVQGILLTAICPRSLSFRPLVLPVECTIELVVSERSRAGCDIVVDGRSEGHLMQGEKIRIWNGGSHEAIPVISTGNWVDDMRIINYNRGFEGRNTSHIID